MKIMNNIIVEDDNISFEDEVVSIQINTHTLNMYIIGNVTLNELKCNPNLKKLNITIEPCDRNVERASLFSVLKCAMGFMLFL